MNKYRIREHLNTFYPQIICKCENGGLFRKKRMFNQWSDLTALGNPVVWFLNYHVVPDPVFFDNLNDAKRFLDAVKKGTVIHEYNPL